MQRAGETMARWLNRNPHWPILPLLATWLVAALWLGNDFGSNYDEIKNAVNGAAALRAYAGSPDYFALPSLADHGPVYFAVMSLAAPQIEKLSPDWSVADGRHLTHFLTFLSAVYCFYLLGLRLAGRTSAWMASLLFATQPLLVGNGFVNQKDMPFLALFLATFVAGLAAVDRMAAPTGQAAGSMAAANPTQLELMKARWRTMTPNGRWLLVCATLIASLVVVDALWLGWTRQAGETILKSAYQGRALPPVQQLFDAIATDAHKTPLDYYLTEFDSFHAQRLRLPLAVAGLLGILAILRIAFPEMCDRWGLSWSALRNPALWTSAVLLGFTVNVRQLGVFVGGLVTLALLRRRRGRAVFPLMVYWITAAIVLYATWPYLWTGPASQLLGSFAHVARFPSHRTFFEGAWVSSYTLPWYYFPKLAAIQLTEPAVLLAIIGMGVAVLRSKAGKAGGFNFFLLGLWIGVPAVALIFLGMGAYGNIRHLLFTIPAILAFTSVAFEELRRRVRPEWLAWSAFGLAILPGVWGLISLHPYEYIYMNGFVGGVSGASGRYEFDRYCISLREGIEAANRLAGPGSVVEVRRQVSAVRPFARPDLRLVEKAGPLRPADFVLTCSWPEEVDLGSEGLHRVYTVQRGEAVFATLWQR